MEMTKTEYDAICDKIYFTRRVESAPDGDDSASFDAEFHFEAKQRGFTDAEIAASHKRYEHSDVTAFVRNPWPGGY